jgi:preprotein translocase subunit SecE
VPDKKNTRPNIFRRIWDRIREYLRETIGELRKVNWPTRQEAIRLTQIVVLVIFLMAAILGGLDALFSELFALIIA